MDNPFTITPASQTPYFILDHFGHPRQVQVLRSKHHENLPRSYVVKPVDGQLVAEHFWGRSYCMVGELTVFDDRIVQVADPDQAAEALRLLNEHGDRAKAFAAYCESKGGN